MSDIEIRRGIFYYLNPFFWIRALFSYILTLFLLFNRFFAIFFGCFVVIFVALFFYDRYSNFTYGDYNDQGSPFKVGFFKDAQKYTSPLAEKNNALSKKMSAFYASKIQPKKKKDVDAKKSVQKPKTEQQFQEQNHRADLNPNTAKDQIATKSYQDQWDTRPYKSIQSEVRRRTVKGRK